MYAVIPVQTSHCGSRRVRSRRWPRTRAGAGIRLDLVGGAVFVVTVDDAATGASVLQTAIADQPTARAHP
jgi:hypothetical protein